MFAEKLAEMQTAFDSKLQEALDKQAAEARVFNIFFLFTCFNNE